MKINFIRLDHVNVTVPIGGEDAAREFYGGLLGMSAEEIAQLQADGVV